MITAIIYLLIGGGLGFGIKAAVDYESNDRYEYRVNLINHQDDCINAADFIISNLDQDCYDIEEYLEAKEKVDSIMLETL